MAQQEGKKEDRSQARPRQVINPFESMRYMMNRMMDSFMEPLGRIAPPDWRLPGPGFAPSVDVIEEDEFLRIEVEAPGMRSEDIALTITPTSVVIRGEKKETGVEGHGIHRRERLFGPFRRVIPLPLEVDREGAEATFKNGVLTIMLPKSHEAARKIEIRKGEE